ncbi:Ribosomal RNA small subunit methyltransferase E [Thalassoporum mexicanum PCC 7367]|uniref:RsmE family RNA methyltransferase n=1 Tax=Thalassoporum mexicanum TaxID=3457544 RepID=UPI00029F954F|nr:RsmE family RNA methyltransferase [Pseudanabaena sp. PCC 7367]AFY70270.1 Ribosomal RNA small subunit methyltransferase E [Pseudanabaena sp. PCC 7367]
MPRLIKTIMSDRPTPAHKLQQIQQQLGQRLQRLTLRSHQSPPVVIDLASYQPVELTNEQEHYLIRVLRLSAGDKFVAIDGSGRWWLAQIELSQGEKTAARLLELILTDHTNQIEIILAVAMPKGNSFEAIVKPAVELGVDRIVPLYSDRTVFNANKPIGQQKQQRWQRIAQEATEQSLQTRIAQIELPQNFQDFAQGISDRPEPNQAQQFKYICITDHAPHLLSSWQQEWRSLSQFLISDQQSKQSINLEQNDRNLPTNSTDREQRDQLITTDRIQLIIATGPEGGWTKAEEAIAKTQGFQAVSLGTSILTATTAPVVALAIVNGVMQADDYK